jgi:hypothetical protein
MNTLDVLKWGNATVVRSLEGVPMTEWQRPGVCGVWSVRQIVAHLASFEWLFVDALAILLEDAPTPHLDTLARLGPGRFNDFEVGRRDAQSPEETLAEYQSAFETAAGLARRVPAERFRETGAARWYGADYDLDDVICYQYYGHKREHMAQVDRFRDHEMAKR